MTSNNLFVKSGFVRAPIFNGVGRFVCQLQRITVKFCKEHADCKGLRDFIEHDIVDFAKKNPSIVVYLKPRRHRPPVVKAEYLNGEEETLRVKCMDREEIAKWIELLRTNSGQPTMRLRKMQHTGFPSIQGVWTPWTNLPPANNLESYPNDNYPAIQHEKTATEHIRDLYAQQRAVDEVPRASANENA